MKRTTRTPQQMISLKEKVDAVIRSGRDYYKGGKDSALQVFLAHTLVLKEYDPVVHHLMDNATIFYLSRTQKPLTYKQIYHIIDHLCGTTLEER